ncbi:MAG TPA: transglutaminaseTgpA domain-containing protein [Candidatus Acidoferrales bacterium]|nr:transglutaminaseTgpA domain-containing protein [Candidatus Acidoferrales bacterium]
MAALSLRLPRSPTEDSPVARAFAFGGFAVATLAIALYGVDPVALVALPLVAWGHWVSYRRRRLPRGFLRQLLLSGLVFACVAYFLLDSTTAVFGGQLPQAHFAIMLLGVTSFDLKTRRNCYSSLWISLAILYLAAVYAWDYWFWLFAAAWILCLAGMWAASHLRGWEAGFRFPRGAVALTLAGSLVAGSACFALLPEPAAPPGGPLVISLPGSAAFKGELENPALPLVEFGTGPAGANGSIDLRYRGRLGAGVVMYVRTGAPAYWRGLVFDTYRDGAWTASRRETRNLPPYVRPGFLPAPEAPNLGTFLQVFRVTRRLPGVVLAAAPLQSAYVPVSELRLDEYGTLHSPEPFRPGQTYSVVSYLPDLSPRRLSEPSAEPDARDPLDLDAATLSDAARRLAREATAGAANRYQAVAALTDFLQSRYRYSLELGRVPAGRDPVDWFLFDVRIGYCEQFATAETLLLRSLGIPARLATGYSTGDYDPVLNQAVVRERDAHAWVEAYFPGRGWVPVDPSPGFPALAAASFPNRWAAAGLARVIPHLELAAPTAVLGTLGWLAFGPGLVAALVALGLALAGVLALRWPRGSARPAPGEGELMGLYDRLQRRLRRRRAPPETPLEYSLSVDAGAWAGLLGEVTDAVNRGAYAGRWPDPKEVTLWGKRLR